MSTVATAQSQPRPQRGGNPGRGRRTNRGGRGRGAPNSVPAAPQPAATVPTQSIPQSVAQNVDEAAQEEDDVCWICAEPVKYYSVSACNHRTCHVCALRLRALYKKNECTFCKVRSMLDYCFRFQSPNVSIGASAICHLHHIPRCSLRVLHARERAIQGF